MGDPTPQRLADMTVRLESLIEKVKFLIETSYHYPASGTYQMTDLIRLFQREEQVKELIKEIYNVEDVYQLFVSNMRHAIDVRSHVLCRIDDSLPGMRFSQKSDLFLTIEIHREGRKHTLILPFIERNIEALLPGVVWSTESEQLLHFLEYGVVIERTGRKMPYRSTFSPNLRREPLPSDVFYSLLELEDTLIYCFIKSNYQRLIRRFRSIPSDIYDLNNWTISYTDILSHERRTGTTLDTEWKDFEQYLHDIHEMGGGGKGKVEPVDVHLPAMEDNAEWFPARSVFPFCSLEDSKATMRPTRYYPDRGYTKFEPVFIQGMYEVTYQGKTQTILDWSRESGLRIGLLYDRYLKGVKDNFLDPDVPANHLWPLEADGRTQTIREWSEELGIPEQTLIRRVRRGRRGMDALRPVSTRDHKKEEKDM